MAKRLLVEGLDWGVKDEDLVKVFSPFGELLEAKVALDWESGRSRGFAHVTFEQAEDAESARVSLHGQRLAGKTLQVMLAPDQTLRRAGGAKQYRSVDYGYVEEAKETTRLFRNVDFGYVDVAPKALPVDSNAASLDLAAGFVTSTAKREDIVEVPPARPLRNAKPKADELDDEERVNRAKYGGGWERGENDTGRGGGGSPFG